ncbi:hypothetical protein BY996DRAFT_6425292 [Phakopsora pachyrhizi]|nr:hypothetical protein BY996DRAFT_6425292 [Phakopsora pachyrhizi]
MGVAKLRFNDPLPQSLWATAPGLMPGAKQLDQHVAASELALKASANLACDITRAFRETFRSLIPDSIGLADRRLPLRDALKSWEKEFGTAEDKSTEEGVRGVTAGRDRAAVVGDDEGQGGAEDELLAGAAEMGDADGPELAVKINEFLWRAGRLEMVEVKSLTCNITDEFEANLLGSLVLRLVESPVGGGLIETSHLQSKRNSVRVGVDNDYTHFAVFVT